MKIRPSGAADEQTDTTKLIVAFRNFANAPKNLYHLPHTLDLCILYASRNTEHLFPHMQAGYLSRLATGFSSQIYSYNSLSGC
jgi:hypothetical protein